MNAAAAGVVRDLADINVAYGVSDEFRYVTSLPPSTHKLSWLTKGKVSCSISRAYFLSGERGNAISPHRAVLDDLVGLSGL